MLLRHMCFNDPIQGTWQFSSMGLGGGMEVCRFYLDTDPIKADDHDHSFHTRGEIANFQVDRPKTHEAECGDLSYPILRPSSHPP